MEVLLTEYEKNRRERNAKIVAEFGKWLENRKDSDKLEKIYDKLAKKFGLSKTTIASVVNQAGVSKAHLESRNEAIVAEFEHLSQEPGSMKTAIYQKIADDFGISVGSVRLILLSAKKNEN